MMKSVFLSLFLILTFIVVNAQDDVLFTVGNQKISESAFDRAYKKNYNVNATEKQSVEDYLGLFIKFRLKVAAAMDAGMDTVAGFKQEYKSYRDQLAKTYLTDNDELEALLQECYDRTAYEVKAGHIMVRLTERSTPADTLAAFHKITDIRKRIVAGESFEKVAAEVSEDPSAKSNQGNLGYFSAFRFPYSFESVCFKTPVGELSQPCRTRFGYHLIKVYDKRLSPGEVKVAHIMLAVPQDGSEAKWNEAKTKITAISERLQKGEDFGKVAREVSEDYNSAKKDGELPWFSSGRMVPEFEQAAFALQTKGGISAPIKTHFGWHILKLIDKRPVASFNAIKADLKTKLLKDERSELINTAFIEKLKKTWELHEFKNNLSYFIKLDTGIYKQKYDQLPASCLQLPLFTISNQKYTVDSFKRFLSGIKAPDKSIGVNDFVQSAYNAYVKKSLIAAEDSHLEEKFSDFKNLTEEYHDGILLFNIMDQEVWGKATRDTAGLVNYFNKTASKYKWGDRVDATIYKFKDKASAEKAKDALEKNKKGIATDALIKLVCDTVSKQPCVEADHKLFSKGDNTMLDSAGWKKGNSKIFAHANAFYIIQVKEKRKPEPKKLEEVRGLVTAEYQNVLEEKWLEVLNNKYKVVVNQDLLHKIAEKYKHTN